MPSCLPLRPAFIYAVALPSKKFWCSTPNTSLTYINKSIDEGINVSLKSQAESLVKVKTDIAGVKAQIKALDKEVDKLEVRLEAKNSNPLAK